MSGLSGINQLADVARAARLAGGDVPKKLKRNLARVGPPAKKAITESAEETLPHSGGYAALVSRSLRVRTKVDTGFTSAGITIVTYADGKARRRDVPTLNRGRLRHPVHGHRRRKWVTQKVKPGFWDRAADRINEDATQRVRDVLDETTRQLKG
ncbi:MAG TPA: hypothetical protein VFR67_05940 [Pilimelia sp.]|nr:hypothetical protein [Pilimelia sp.]